jgi:flagellar biosynthesis protein FlhA
VSTATGAAAAMLAPARLRALAAPLLVVLILAMMILPLPPLLLDLLFTFNIALALIVMLVAVYTAKPLDFAAFPTVLLLTTLMRLSLNVASSRVVLMDGHTGADAAGKVIEAFGHFLVGADLAVGIVVFAILVVINFVVVTKGAGRIAEVSARFTLDAMPGKQMAIDADLNAGLIGEAQARKRREEIAQEAEFYGAMDGASKFVRGDAVAGILILVVNVLGGLAVGMLRHGLSLDQAADNYVLLAIGDGLVAQIPALVISMAAGLVVSRVGNGQDIGQQLLGQLFNAPQVLGITGGILAMLGLIPGMPTLSFLLFGAAAGGFAWWLKNRPATAPASAQEADAQSKPTENAEATWDDLAPVDVLGLEVGYRLISLVDSARAGELLKRIKGIRKKFAQEIGFLPPPVHIRDNLELKPTVYRVTLKGVVVGEGEIYPEMVLAINPGSASGQLVGTPTKDPAFGLPATWISAESREQAQLQGYTVVDPSSVIATHLDHLIRTQADALMGRQEVQDLLTYFGKHAPKLVEDLVPKVVPVATLQKVLQNLLAEGVHIRDLRTIVETLAEHAQRTQDALELTAHVRTALSRAIVQQLAGPAPELKVIVIEPELEKLLQQGGGAGAGEGFGIEPALAETLLRDTAAAVQKQEALGQQPVLLASDRLRLPLARMLRKVLPQLSVLAHSEINDTRGIKVSSIVGART